MEVIKPVTAAVTGSLKVAVAVASTAAQELPKNYDALYYVTTTTAVYVKFGVAAVGAASATDYTLFLPANWSGFVVAPGKYVRAIRDSADGTLVFVAVAAHLA